MLFLAAVFLSHYLLLFLPGLSKGVRLLQPLVAKHHPVTRADAIQMAGETGGALLLACWLPG